MTRTQHIDLAELPFLAPEGGERFLWDTIVPQLAERRRGDLRSWIVQTRVGGRTLRRKVGDVADIPVSVAREVARVQLAELENEHSTLDANQRLSVFAPRFLEDCAHQWKPSTLSGHRQGIKNQILPYLGEVPVGKLTREDVVQWRTALTSAAGTKNRALAVLSSMLRHAEILGLRAPGQNPCAGLRRHQSSFKADYLDAKGFAILGRVLEREVAHFPRAVPFIWFLALTGCRKGEAMKATWDQLDGRRLALPDAKSGPKAIWLGKPVRDLLACLPRHGVGIFAGGDARALEAELRALWKIVRTALRRPRFRLHDLRHSYASVGINRGLNLQMIGGLLGHSDIDSTAGYAQLDAIRIAEASQRVGKHFERAFKPARKRPVISPRSCPDTSDFARFAAGKPALHHFCAENNLNPRAFHAGLVAWRKEVKHRRAVQ